MADEINEQIIVGGENLRLENLTLPNGNTYTLGCSFEEAQEIYNVLNENIEAVNAEVTDADKIVAASLNDLNSRIQSIVLAQDGNKTLLNELNGRLNDLSNSADETEEIIADSLNDLNTRLVSLNDSVLEDEEIVAATLNDLNARLDNSESSLDTRLTTSEGLISELSDSADETERVVASALNYLNSRITATDESIIEVNSRITDLSNAVVNAEMEISAALNDLNTRLSGLATEVELIKSNYLAYNSGS